jgi:hypothetical protein
MGASELNNVIQHLVARHAQLVCTSLSIFCVCVCTRVETRVQPGIAWEPGKKTNIVVINIFICAAAIQL